jgi:putative DNA methylase
MTRMIERWFPCAEVSANSRSGWGSGNTEVGIMTWFAKRPSAQAKAATICSLLPWPDDPAEQRELQKLVREAMKGRWEKATEIRRKILLSHPDGVSTLDPFSGRGMIPLETSRLGLPASAIDYSPVAAFASCLLTDFPFRTWDDELPLPYAWTDSTFLAPRPRLVRDVDAVLSEIGTRHRTAMSDYYPQVGGKDAWGYLWAITIPCHECSRPFPLVGQLELRKPSTRKSRKTTSPFRDLGQSYYINADRTSGTWSVVVHDGPPKGAPTRQVPLGKSRFDSSGRVAVCPFCRYPHERQMQMRILQSGLGCDVPILAADIDPTVGKSYRPLDQHERTAIDAAATALRHQPEFSRFLPAVPNEQIPSGNTWTVQASVYGVRCYGDMMNTRQTLSFIILARCIDEIGSELAKNGNSHDYTRALTGYGAAVLARKLRRATRGCTLDVSRSGVHDIFATESSLNFSFDYFEVGLANGPGSWESVSEGTLSALSGIMPPTSTIPCQVTRSSALSLPSFRDQSISAIITDPPYGAMIDYTDASDLFYVWIKRALAATWPEFGMTAHEFGVQEKQEEIIVKKGGTSNNDHRDKQHYSTLITKAFHEMGRIVARDGVVTIVFGHGEVEAWQRLITAIHDAGLILTAAWPAKTEPGGRAGFTNIVTTLTIACRPAPPDRPAGRKGAVESAIKAEIKRRYLDWERWGLAPADMLMAAVGPAMEIVGKYSQVLDARGEPYNICEFLQLACAAVREAMAIKIDHQPLEEFDARTGFALWWVEMYRRQSQPKSELRWQALASSIDLASVRDLVRDANKGVRFITSREYGRKINGDSAVIDVALALAAASREGLQTIVQVLADAKREADDVYLWATIQYLANRLLANDPDAISFTRVLRARDGIRSAAEALTVGGHESPHTKAQDGAQPRPPRRAGRARPRTHVLDGTGGQP